MLYRGLRMLKSEVDSYMPNKTIHLMGYTSTTLNISVAKNFAQTDDVCVIGLKI